MSAPFPGERSTHIDLTEYGYASDSDLEDESEGDETAPLTMTPPLEDAEVMFCRASKDASAPPRSDNRLAGTSQGAKEPRDS